jgi:hypothetical protein
VQVQGCSLGWLLRWQLQAQRVRLVQQLQCWQEEPLPPRPVQARVQVLVQQEFLFVNAQSRIVPD